MELHLPTLAQVPPWHGSLLLVLTGLVILGLIGGAARHRHVQIYCSYIAVKNIFVLFCKLKSIQWRYSLHCDEFTVLGVVSCIIFHLRSSMVHAKQLPAPHVILLVVVAAMFIV